MLNTAQNLNFRLFSKHATLTSDEKFLEESRHPSNEMNMIEEMSATNKCIYFLSDFENLAYSFYTQNFYKLKTLFPEAVQLKWDAGYPPLLTDRFLALKYMSLLKRLACKFSPDQLQNMQCTCCGYFINNRNNLKFRCLYKSSSLSTDECGGLKLSVDSLSNVAGLMGVEPGCWIRCAGAGSVIHWHSRTNKLVPKEILSQREIEIVGLWKQGYAISEIADALCVSSFTIKNQLANARQKLLARDNTSLVQLCIKAGILSTDF